MSRANWFRKSSWTAADQAAFYERLRKQKSLGLRAQYLRIQAAHLSEVGSEEMTHFALELLDRILAEYPESTDRAMAFVQKAECYARLGQLEESLNAYRAAIETERRRPNVQTYAWLAFARTVVENERRDLFPEALAILQDTERHMMSPREMFYSHALLAVLLESLGRMHLAQEAATIARRHAEMRHSGLRYHPAMGLVDEEDKARRLYSAVERLADQTV